MNGINLCNEIEVVRSLYSKKDSCPLEILTFINDNKLQDTIPNLWVALKIMMTIPVTTASYERSFSKLKLIKTYLRSTMTEERLNNLALISIENEIVSKLNLNEAIQNFADLKSRKKCIFKKKLLLIIFVILYTIKEIILIHIIIIKNKNKLYSNKF